MANNAYVIYWPPSEMAPCPQPQYLCADHMQQFRSNGGQLVSFPEALGAEDIHRHEQCRLCWMQGRA